MEENIRNKKYEINEAVAYYILGYKRFEQNEKQNGLKDILKNVLEVANENIKTKEIIGVNKDLLKNIRFLWNISADEFVAYAVCIFYVLINREIQITDEKIVKEFITTVHSHHPRKVMEQAEVILTNIFPDWKEDDVK